MNQDDRHVRAEQLERLVRDELRAEERRSVVRHLLGGCEPCLATARSLLFLETEVDYSEAVKESGIRD